MLLWLVCCILPLCHATGPGKALFFDHSSTYQVRTADISGLEDGFTIAFWGKLHRPADSASDNFAGFSGTMFAYVDEAETQNIFLFAEYQVLVILAGTNDSLTVYQNGDDVDWHHYSFSYNDTSGILNFFRDGNLTYTSDNNEIDPFNSAHTGFMKRGHFLLGKSIFSSDTPLTGFIDEFCVWNTSLPQDTILTIKSRGCIAPDLPEYLTLRLGFDKDQNPTLPDIWNDATSSFDASTAVEETCLSEKVSVSGAYPIHVISSAPFQSDDTPLWIVVDENATTNLTLLCHDCSQVTILSLPLYGKLMSIDGLLLNVSSVVSPYILFEANGSNFVTDSFQYQHNGNTNASVMLKPNTAPTVSHFTLTVPQNGYLVTSIPVNTKSLDAEIGVPESTIIVSITLHNSNTSLFLYQYNETKICDASSTWDFYSCIAVPSNLIPISSAHNVTIEDSFFRIGLMHEGDEIGSGVLTIFYKVYDGLAYSGVSNVTVTVVAVDEAPVTTGPDVLVVVEDTDLILTLGAYDSEADDILVIISELPSHGVLYQIDDDGVIGSAISIDAGSSTIDQWAASATASSQWGNPINFADQIVGRPDVYPLHGDLAGAWQPSESGDFTKQTIHVNITTPVYLTSVHVFETWHPGSTAKVSAYFQETHSWKVLWNGDSQVKLMNPDATTTKSAVWTSNLCSHIYKSNVLRFDLDLTSRQYWAGWDAVSVSGAVAPRAQILLHPSRRLLFRPEHNYNGTDSFSFTVVDCPFFIKYQTIDSDKTRTATVALNITAVNDAPVTQDIEVSVFDGPVANITIYLTATDVDDTLLFFNITSLPLSGDLYDGFGNLINSVPARLGEYSRVVTFVPSKINTRSNHEEMIAVSYSATDPHGASSSSQLIITVQSCMFSNFTYTVSSECSKSHLHRAITVSWNNTNQCIDYDFGIHSVACEYIPATSLAGIGVITVTAVVCAIILGWVCWLLIYQEIPIVRAAQLMVCLLFVVGALTLCLSNLVFLGPNSDFLCMARPWIFYVTFTFMFGPLSIKIWRAHQILQNSAFKRRIISNQEVFLWLLYMLMIDFALLGVWTAVAPLRSHIQTETTIIGPVSNRVCAGASTTSHIFTILLATYKVLVCASTCFWSYQTRNLNHQFAESKHIMFAVYNTAVIGGIISFVLFVAGLSGSSAILLHSFGVCISVLASVLVVLVPKFLARTLTTQDLLASISTSGNPNAGGVASKRTIPLQQLAVFSKEMSREQPDVKSQLDDPSLDAKMTLSKLRQATD